MNYINYNGTEVLPMRDIGELFGVESKILSRNFQRNKENYIEGTHYFILTGEELKRFKEEFKYESKFTSTLYLWTKEGISLLAKSNRSEVAWHMIGTMKSNKADDSKEDEAKIRYNNKWYKSLLEISLDYDVPFALISALSREGFTIKESIRIAKLDKIEQRRIRKTVEKTKVKKTKKSEKVLITKNKREYDLNRRKLLEEQLLENLEYKGQKVTSLHDLAEEITNTEVRMAFTTLRYWLNKGYSVEDVIKLVKEARTKHGK